MKRFVFAAAVAAGAQALAASGCAPGGTGTTGSAGTSGSSPGSAGTTGAAGATSAAGTTGSAGTTSSGAAGTTSSGAAGTTSSGAAGTTGSGGTMATTNTDPATFAYLFNSNVEGWALNTYADTGRANLADRARAASPAPMLSPDSTAGNPNAGSLKVNAHFTDWKQYVDAVITSARRRC